MSNKKQASKTKKSCIPNRNVIIAIAAIVVVVAALLIINGNKRNNAGSPVVNDVVITKSKITETVTFIPAKVGKTNMEIMAVKASDGTIRTAFNTCQVCNGSPRAYYKQDGDIVICQNCGNKFSMDMIEVERGGCNPVPIMEGDKDDNGETITIPKDFIAQNKGLFTENWKTK